MFKPRWGDYLPTYREEASLRKRIESMEYHLATFLTPANMVNSLKFEKGREGLLHFYSMDFNWQRKKLMEILRVTVDLDERFVESIDKAKRHIFVPSNSRVLSYWNGVSWVSGLNGITPPWFAAFAASLLDLKPGKKVLVVGFGYGYASAVFYESMEERGEIFGIDIDEEILDIGKKIRSSCGYENFHFKVRNGIQGWGSGSFDAIWPTLSSVGIPNAWTKELEEDGKLCIFRPLTDREFEYAVTNDEWFKQSFPTYRVYESRWWEETCLSTYKKEDGELVEVSRFYDLFNPPFLDEEYGTTALKEWKADLGVAETKLLSFLKENLRTRVQCEMQNSARADHVQRRS